MDADTLSSFIASDHPDGVGLGAIPPAIGTSLSGPESIIREIQGGFEFLHARAEAPTTVEIAEHGRHGMPMFEFGEHSYLGDKIQLTTYNGTRVSAETLPLMLGNGVSLTYGQIAALAGDFYGTNQPISGKIKEIIDDSERTRRFNAAVETMTSGWAAAEIKDLLNILATERNEIYSNPDNRSPNWYGLDASDLNMKLEWATRSRPKNVPAYIGLAAINFDHFGEDARTAYRIGHTSALQMAAASPPPGDAWKTLYRAYVYNAFADHFLADSFSSGHLRTPRRTLHDSTGAYDLCAKFMHDEDSAIGLTVNNVNGDSWTCYGDKMLFASSDQKNYTLASRALELSAAEIYKAWQTKTVPGPDTYAALRLVPTLESARDMHAQDLAPLFLDDGLRRTAITNRRSKSSYSNDWWAWSTASECKLSGWWKYRMTLDGGGNPPLPPDRTG